MKSALQLRKTRIALGLTFLFFLALAPSFFGVLEGSWPFSDDAVAWFAPARQWAAASLAHGVLPLWNPHVFLGMPFISNGQTAVLYPFNIIYWILPIRGALLGDAFFHGVLLGVGGYFLARVLERSRSASILCAMCLMFGNGVAAHLYAGHMTWHAARAYLPWEIAVLILYLRQPRLRHAVTLAVLFALQFYSGYPPYVVWSVAWCGVFLLAWGASRVHESQNEADAALAGAQREPRNPLPNVLGIWLRHWALAGVLLLLLSTLAILPFREMSRLTSHGVALTFEQAVVPSSTLAGWARLVLPTFFGGNSVAQWSLKNYPHEEAAYIGLIPLLLALGAPLWLMGCKTQLATRFREKPFVLVLWIILPLAMVMALGNHTPLYRFVFDIFPPLRVFRAPARWMEIWYFAACLLAAFSFDALLNSDSNRRHLLRLISGLTALFILLAVVIGLSSLDHFWLNTAQWNMLKIIRIPAQRMAYAEYLRMTALSACFIAAVIGLLGIFLIRSWQRSTVLLQFRWQVGLLALMALDVLIPFWSSARFIAPTDWRSQWSPNIATFYKPNTRWVTMLQGDDVNFGLNQGMPLGIDSLGGYDPLAGSQFFDLTSKMEGQRLWSSQYQPMRYDSLWRVAGITHVYIDGSHPFVSQLKTRGATLLAEFGKTKRSRQLWRLNDTVARRAWPRYYLTNDIVRAPVQNHLSILQANAQSPPFAVLPMNTFSKIANTSKQGRVTQIKRSGNVIQLQTETSATQVLVQSEALSPGWRAWVNGKSTKIERANFMFRGIAVPVGKSKIAIVYDNQTFRFAGFLTLCGLALMAGILSFAFSITKGSRLKPWP